jgi:hypothetical protein
MEGVTGSNPVAPTTILAGQRCYQLLADSAPHTPRPRCGRRLCPLNGTGPPEPDDTRPTPAQQPRSVVTPLPFSPMVEHHAGNLPRTHLRGTCERLLLLMLPANQQAPRAGPAPLIGQTASASPQLVRLRSGGPGVPSTLVRAGHGQRSTIPSQPGPIRAATTKPLGDHSDTSNPVRQTWPVPRHRRPGSSAVRTARTPDACPDACLSGHSDHTGRVDTGRLDTGRPRDQVDGRPDGGQSDERRGRRPDILDGHDDGGAG